MKYSGLLLFFIPLLAQQPNATTTTTTQASVTSVAVVHRRAVPAEHLYTHIITVVPFTGRGTYDDPKRPLYAPAKRASTVDRNEILGFAFLPSDDGKFAIVEYVVANKSALSSVYADLSLTIFEKGKVNPAIIETALKVFRKGFSLNQLAVTVQ